MADVRYDEHGKITCMCWCATHVMVRRPRCSPFVLTVLQWAELSRHPL